MGDINQMTPEELNEALKQEIAEIDSTTTIEEDNQEEDYQQEDSQDEGEEQEEDYQEEVKPVKKNKNNVSKILKDRNYWRNKAKELEEMVGQDKDTDLEYINATATKVAMELIEEREFFKDYPEAGRYQGEVKEIQNKYGMDLEDAFTFFKAKNNPKDLEIEQNKQNSRKLSTNSYVNTKLRNDKPISSLTTEELEQRVRMELKAGRVII